MKKVLYLLSFLVTALTAPGQIVYQREIPVVINGLTFDAMEPFISPDGETLFFNSLNDGVNTSLYFASRINDSTFQYEGAVLNVNQPPPHLDAVASIDLQSKFYWVSTRDYPTVFQNLMKGTYSNGLVTGIAHVYGDFYVYSPGWLVMDAAISTDGNRLIYCNAYFNNCSMGLPCKASLGIAQKVNDSTFMKLPGSTTLFENINDTSFLVYAPQLSSDGLELYYTRLEKNTTETQICISIRSDTTQAFPGGTVLYSNSGTFPEAPTISPDRAKLYYHRKENNVYRIFLKMRTLTDIGKTVLKNPQVYPNPAVDIIFIRNADAGTEITLTDLTGRIVLKEVILKETTNIDVSSCARGTYLVSLISDQKRSSMKLYIAGSIRNLH